MENTNTILKDISKKLSILIALSLQGEKNTVEVKDNVARLIRFGLTDNEIAEILGTTAGTISVTKVRLKKAKKQK